MMEEWKEYRLGDVADITKLAGFEFTKYMKYISDGEIIAIRALNLRNGQLDLHDVQRISRKVSDGLIRSKLHEGETILSYTGTIGACAIITENDKYHLAPNVCKVTPSKIVYPFFLYYIIRSEYFQSALLGYAHGSTQPTIPMKTIREIPIKICSFEKQIAIANILKSFDDKIEVNRRINDNLEQQAQALFKSWFVDFEPFKNGEFVESELGMIPKGWKVIQLIDIAEISKNSINPQKQPQTIFNHYSIPAFDEGMKPEIQLGEEIKSNKFVITNKMTLFSKLNPRIKRIWYVDKLNSNSICSTEFVPYKSKVESQSSFLYSLINSQGFYDYVMSMVNGATGSHQRFHPEESLKYNIAFNYQCVSKYCEVMSPIISQILENREESRRLAELRDTLLPHLMSGEIKVGDVTL